MCTGLASRPHLGAEFGGYTGSISVEEVDAARQRQRGLFDIRTEL
jgi:hypothetical protein